MVECTVALLTLQTPVPRSLRHFSAGCRGHAAPEPPAHPAPRRLWPPGWLASLAWRRVRSGAVASLLRSRFALRRGTVRGACRPPATPAPAGSQKRSSSVFAGREQAGDCRPLPPARGALPHTPPELLVPDLRPGATGPRPRALGRLAIKRNGIGSLIQCGAFGTFLGNYIRRQI